MLIDSVYTTMLSDVMLNGVILIVVIPNAVMLSAVILIVVIVNVIMLRHYS